MPFGPLISRRLLAPPMPKRRTRCTLQGLSSCNSLSPCVRLAHRHQQAAFPGGVKLTEARVAISAALGGDILPEDRQRHVLALGLKVQDRPIGLGKASLYDPQINRTNADMAEVLSFHFGLPREVRIRELRNVGVVLFATATNVDEARAAVDAGVDVIVAQGYEAGEHRGIAFGMAARRLGR